MTSQDWAIPPPGLSQLFSVYFFRKAEVAHAQVEGHGVGRREYYFPCRVIRSRAASIGNNLILAYLVQTYAHSTPAAIGINRNSACAGHPHVISQTYSRGRAQRIRSIRTNLEAQVIRSGIGNHLGGYLNVAGPQDHPTPSAHITVETQVFHTLVQRLGIALAFGTVAQEIGCMIGELACCLLYTSDAADE